MAAAVLANRASEVDVPKIIVTSSGTGSWHVGEGAHQLSEKVWTAAGYSHSHVVRQFQVDHFDEVDLILAMDLSNHANILRLARKEEDRQKVAMLRSFDPATDAPSHSLEVPDPWGNPIESYQEVLEMVERSVSGLLESLKQG